VFIYGPILIASLADPNTTIKVEGINYFADTLLFAGVVLALASGSFIISSQPSAPVRAT
jgi:hypothetical protein